MPTAASRLATPILAGLLALSGVGPAAAADLPPFDAATLRQARTDLTIQVNAQRTAHSLVGLQVDPQAVSIAQYRAETMATMDALTHMGPDGRTVFDLIEAAGITWFGAGEVLGWNSYSSEADSTTQAVSAWLASPSHRSIILSTDYNYVGFGAAVSPATGNRYYSGLFLKSPDITGGWTRPGSTSVEVLDSTKSRVTVRWTGSDIRLQVLTSGLRDFEIQRRVGVGSWLSLGSTTRTSLSATMSRGHVYEFRFRARDNAGNRGAWSSISVTT